MEIRRWFSRYHFFFNIALIVLIGYLAARTTNSMVAGAILPVAKASEVEWSAPGVQSAMAPAPVDAIVNRDLFDAKRPEPGEEPGARAGDSAGEVEVTELRLSLLGVAFFRDQAQSNIATIRNLQDQKLGVFRAGEQVFDQAKLAEVKLDRVILERQNGDKEELLLEPLKRRQEKNEVYDPYHGLSPKEREENLRQRREQLENHRPGRIDLSDRIKQVGENSFVIQRSAIIEALANMDAIITQARLLPNFVGEGDARVIDGFRCLSIKPGSIFQNLGLKNGDVIKSINGEKLDSMEKAYQSLQSLKSETRFTLDLERQGAALNYQYEVE